MQVTPATPSIHFRPSLQSLAVPCISRSGAVNQRPVEGGDPGMGIDSPQSSGQPPWAGWRVVSPGYFAAVGLQLLRGRIFDENDKPVWTPKDVPPYPRHVILSDRLAKQIFPNEDPIGKQGASLEEPERSRGGRRRRCRRQSRTRTGGESRAHCLSSLRIQRHS